MKMSGWVVEAAVVKIPHSQYKAVFKAIVDGSIADIQKLLNHNNISTAGTIVLQNGKSIGLLEAAIPVQQVDVVKLLVETYSVDFCLESTTVVGSIFCTMPQSFAIEFLKLSGVRHNFKFGF